LSLAWPLYVEESSGTPTMSLKEELSLYWTRLQEGLFPRLEAMVGSLTPLYKKLNFFGE
jgi:hypothetical protein